MNLIDSVFLTCALAATALAFVSPRSAHAQDDSQGWKRSTQTFDKERIDALDAKVADQTYQQINSIIVIRDGELLVERYYNGATATDTHNPRSVGKTFASAVLGIAIEEGHIQGLDQTLGDFYDLTEFDNSSGKKASVTLEQLLTMTSGFEGFDFDPESIGNEENMYPTADWVEWTLNLPMADREPGDSWAYFTAGIVVLGDILNRAVPGGLEAYAHRKLFAPLGIDSYEWQHTPQRVANTAGGVQLTPLGFAKFGEMYRTGGTWQGSRVLPIGWAEASLEPRVEAVDGFRYGYLWWCDAFEVDGTSLPYSACSGNGGNKIFVFRDQPLVAVVTASAYGQPYAHRQVNDLMVNHVLPTVLSTREHE